MDLYAENILDHYRHPRGKVSLASPTIEHEEVNASCGDTLTVQLDLQEGTVKAVGWSGTGCAISQAAMSLLGEELAGKTEADILGLTPKDVYDLLGVPVGPRRVKCALLCLHSLKNALHKAQGKAAQSWSETVALAEGNL